MRVLNGIFITVFMTMLTLPLVFIDFSSNRVSVQENRMLAKRPLLSGIESSGTFIRDFDAWFKDSTGFREQLVMLYKIVFGSNSWLNGNNRYAHGQYIYIIGEQEHHYFADINGILIQKFQGKQFIPDDQLTNLAVRLELVKTYLDKKGIPLIVMFCTDKESVYPEFYSKTVKRGPEPIQLDVITGYLQEHTGVDVFNIRKALLDRKDSFLLYDKKVVWAKTDNSLLNNVPLVSDLLQGDLSHYNEIGAFFAYRELMRHINAYLPEISPYELDDVEIRYDEIERPHVSLKQGNLYIRLDMSFFDDVNIGTGRNYACENTESELPVILFMRDSYADEHFIGKYIAQHFGRTIMIDYPNMEHFEEYIDKYKPDIVVFESAERELPRFAECFTYIRNIEIFSQLYNKNTQLVDVTVWPSHYTDDNWENGLLRSDNTILLFENFPDLQYADNFIIPGTDISVRIKNVELDGKFQRVHLADSESAAICANAETLIFQVTLANVTVWPSHYTDDNWENGLLRSDNTILLFENFPDLQYADNFIIPGTDISVRIENVELVGKYQRVRFADSRSAAICANAETLIFQAPLVTSPAVDYSH